MDIQYMKRALELAENGIGYVNPNPLVGAVIVKGDRIIGEGYHQQYGGPHAEINAFTNASESVEGATMYVTLEPCSHYGKTPPCALTIVEKRIKKVVIGLKDPNPIVAGKGIEILRSSGIEVVAGVLEEEGRKLNEIFLKYITTQLPFVILKTAMTLDGKIATHTGDSKWITNEKSRDFVHQIRHRVAAIMVGIGTVLADDPLLNTRLQNAKGSDPQRIIVDSKASIPLTSKILNMESNAGTIIAVTEQADKDKVRLLQKKGAEVIVLPSSETRVDLRMLIEELGGRKIDSILLEGGGALNYSALEAGIVDKVYSFIAPKLIGGRDAKTPIEGVGKEYMKDAILLQDIDIHRFEQDIMIEGYIRREV
jgi:diaminohydroxyphosphoribosylaminopyrimidine deaminase/5-amino-6-(5-phosphoribosylamino)uracil reductase